MWYLKQLLPLTYRSKYKKGDKKIFCVWNMWLGKCFNIEEYEIVGNEADCEHSWCSCSGIGGGYVFDRCNKCGVTK